MTALSSNCRAATDRFCWTTTRRSQERKRHAPTTAPSGDSTSSMTSNLQWKICVRASSLAPILWLLLPETPSLLNELKLGGPYWSVPLGRRDSTTASLSLANANLPGPGMNLSQLISKFQTQNLFTTDMIALSGAHTIGQAQCKNFRSHIYNDSNIDSWYAASLQENCPFSSGDTNLSPLDYQSPTLFNNDYFNNLVAFKGLLHSDQELYNNGSADSTVESYSINQTLFFSDFVSAMISMGNINPLTGTQGEIRINCRKAN